MRRKYLAFPAVLLIFTATLHAVTIYVDDDAPNDPGPFNAAISDPAENGSQAHPFDEIQKAIDRSSDGDTIIVEPGHYLSPDTWQYGQVAFVNKNIHLVSSAPNDFSVAEKTILCGVVIFGGMETSDCLLQGFKIQNHDSGGILGNGTHATISHCIVSGNGPCGATVIKDCAGLIQNCLIVDNTTFHGCAMQPAVCGCMQLVNCTIANNISGISLPVDGSMRNCIVYGNQEGQQIFYDPSVSPGRGTVRERITIRHCLIENWTDLGLSGSDYTGTFDADPCFVQPGFWVGEASIMMRTRGGDSITLYEAGSTLVEGDYHLMSEGWRWNEQEVHGSHWYFDLQTSPGIDAGDPLDGLRDELERVPEDPEGRWGINHAIEVGAYGGTPQASLTPVKGKPLGINAVDLRDYWPFVEGYTWDTAADANRYEIYVANGMDVNGLDAQAVTVQAPLNSYTLFCVYTDYTLSMTQLPYLARGSYSPPVWSRFEVRYPQYLTIGSIIDAPDDPVAFETPQMLPAVVVRGTLAQVIAGTSIDPNSFLAGPWNDAIAFREQNADGTLKGPSNIFARGFGPLMLAGHPVNVATVDGISFNTGVYRR